MASNVRNMKLTSVDDLFSSEESRQAEQQQQGEQVLSVPISEVHDFANNPYHVRKDAELMGMVESIQRIGVHTPCLARPRADGGYELLSGHRRKLASTLAGRDTLPLIVREIDDDSATILVVDGNIQRETISFSEKAKAYKMKLEALNRQGQRVDLTSCQVGTKLESKRSHEILAEKSNDSARNIHRFIRLTELAPPLLQMVDDKKIAFNPAVELSYLPLELDELVRINSDIYTTRTHDSLKISNGKWNWWSRGIGGRSALDYLIKVRGMEFVEAVQHVCDCLRFEQPQKSHTPRPLKKPSFMLPKQGESNDRVIDYLMQRGIGIALLEFCINTGRLYEDERHNCCFVGFDPQGIPRYAMLRSSNTGSTFLREVEGSDKRYSFSLPPQRQSNILYLFESSIDCLSFVELQSMEKGGWTPENYLSLSGVYQPKKELSETPLPIALMQYLQDNPHINCVALCLDNDEAGRLSARTICALLPERYTTKLLLPDKGKDYNHQLQIEKGISPAIRMRGAPER